MDNSTRKYRRSQLDIISEEFRPKIKIISSKGETKWLDIEYEELEEIKKILLRD